jgi:RHS repeat-associated protein
MQQPGYVYIYLSNENDKIVDVYFDELKITHVKSRVLQESHYYPFGLAMSTSWTRETAVNNNYLYNAGSELNDNTQWYEMFFRGYDPALGRMLQIDPVASKYASVSPYNYSFNDPVALNDPSGADPYSSNHYYHRGGPYNNNSNAYFYTDMVNADGGFPHRDRGEAIYGNEGLHGRVLGSSIYNWQDVYAKGMAMAANLEAYRYGNQTIQIGNLVLNLNKMASGVHAFSFSGGSVTGWNTLSIDEVRGLTGRSMSPYNTNRLAVNSRNGDYVQLTASGEVLVPYTETSYASFVAIRKQTQEKRKFLHKSRSISITIAGALFSEGGGLSVGYFWSSNSNGFYATGLFPETSNNLTLTGSLDFTEYFSLTGGEVTYESIMGTGAEVSGSISTLGMAYSEPVHFNQNSESYRSYKPEYRAIQYSIGAGLPIGFAEWNTITIPARRYFKLYKK